MKDKEYFAVLSEDTDLAYASGDLVTIRRKIREWKSQHSGWTIRVYQSGEMEMFCRMNGRWTRSKMSTAKLI